MARLLVALVCLAALPQLAAAQQTDTLPVGIRPRFDRPPLQIQEPAVLRAPWLGAPRLPAGVRGAVWDSAAAAVRDSVRIEATVARRLATVYGAAPAALETREESDSALVGRRGVLGLNPNYADLVIDGQARLELRTDRLRNERCTPQELLDRNSGCRGGFRAPRLENQFNLRSGGVIGRRIHVNVDYDSERDFSGNNDIQVYYQGLEDEIIRRIEVGTVAFVPPRSRFITAAIPTNNFGINAQFEFGPVQVQTLAATQKGSVVAERTFTVGQTTSQPQDRQIRDLDIETGRFFWVVDPARLPGYPAVDILSLDPSTLPPDQRPTEVRVYRFKPSSSRSGADPNLGGVTATALRSDSDQRQGPVRWELLIQGADYYLDRSGLWIALATKLDVTDYLAVSYRTAAGTVVGTFPADDDPGANHTLELIVDPQKGPEVPTFRYEMRQIYRVAGSDLDPASLIVNLSLNNSERPQGGTGTYLSHLGLSIPSDPGVFDVANRLFPRVQDPGAAQTVQESYIVFPHLTPFADPTRLAPAERQDSLYRTPRYLLLTQGPTAKFQFRLRYNSTGGGDRTTLNLNALQIREGSEKLSIGGRVLERDVDYTISYETGQVTFLNPDQLFGSGTAQVTARFEERGLFAIAPTTILGFSTRYSLGDFGAINLISIYQREQTPFNRPPIGFEASANLVAGLNTELRFQPRAITSFMNRLTSSPSTAPSRLDVNAEVALTKPDPNRSGEAYLEEFEADAGVPISLREGSWEYGSVPQRADGVEDVVGAAFEEEDAVQVTWQNLIRAANGQAFELRPQDIDTLIRIAGVGEAFETAMFLTFHADTAGGVVQRNNASRWSLPRRDFEPRWRSLVTSLSNTGLDLTRNEYLEFWMFQQGNRPADAAGLRLIFDLGTVNEDALAIAPDSILVSGGDTLYRGRQYVGRGRLDTERTGTGIFNADVDDIGILGDRPDRLITEDGVQLTDFSLCQQQLSQNVLVYPWGDLGARCTRGNGILDTEDLNGDNVLNASGTNENVFRYIVDVRDLQKYYVRDGVVDQQSGARWQLFRIPIRTPDVVIGTPNLRLIQHLRLTLAAPPDAGEPDVVARFALARMRLVGSPWVRRTETPVRGLAGIVAEPHGEVISSIVSTENRADLGYVSPPGVTDQTNTRGDRGQQGTQINEKSLRVVARDLRAGERAEAYLRFPAGTHNLLAYRQLRVWTRGRGPGWDSRELEAFVRVGSDVNNFYQYRAPASTTTWEPEMLIDLEVWRRLRAQVESRWLAGEPPSGAAECGGLETAYVACEGPYLVHLADPGINPPNLAAVQELSAGILRVAGEAPIAETELWVDDIRLSSPVAELGTALSFDTRLTASDVGDIAISFTRQDGSFRQINQDPSYRTTGALSLSTNWRLERFLPQSLGLTVPLQVSYSRSSVDPQLITGTDLRGSELVGLRRPRNWSATYSLSIRRNVRGRDWVTRGLVDPLFISAALTQGRGQTELSQSEADQLNVQVGYNLQLARGGPSLGLGGLAQKLPRWLRETEGGRSLKDARFGLWPTNIRFQSGLTYDESEFTSYRVPVFRPDDSQLRPVRALNHLWRNSAGLTWQPLGMLTLSTDLQSTRDLRVYSDSTTLGRLAYAERKFLFGMPVGVERDRQFSTTLTLAPRLTSWLRPRYVTSSSFVLSRTLSSREPVQEFGDSGRYILPQTLNNNRSREIGASVDVSRGLRGLLGDSSVVVRLLGRLRPVDLRNRRTRTSTFDLAAFEPSLRYQLGLGGLDEFLMQHGIPAVGASEAYTTAITSGADLPLGITASISYALTRSTRYQFLNDAFAETVTRQVEWPVGNFRWTRTFGGGPLALVSFGAGFRRREGVSVQPTRESSALNSTSSSTITPDLQLGFRNGVNITLGYSALDQETRTSGNLTVLDQDDLTGTLSYSFRLPASISRQRKRVRSSLTAFINSAVTCLQRRNEPDCNAISDVRRQEIRGGLDTDVLRMLTAGLQFGYLINDARHLSRRTSQIFLLANMQLSLYAGDYR